MSAPPAVADPGDSVTYTVSSDAPLMSVTYYDAMDNMQQLRSQPANWSISFTGKATYGLFAVGAQTTGEHVSCQIKINGTVKDQQSAVGRYTVVNCGA
jgi:hypothetical protein